jgi:hypothetical protein
MWPTARSSVPEPEGVPAHVIFSGAGGVLVSAHDGGVDHHFPVDLADGVRAGLGMGQQSLPGAVGLPAADRS